MVIISTTEQSLPNSRFNTSNVSDPHSSIGSSEWWSPFTDEEAEALGQPAVSGGLSSSETLLLCPPCKAASQIAWPHTFHRFLSDLGASQEGGRGLSELPSESNTGAWSSCQDGEGPVGWVPGVWSQESWDALGHRGQFHPVW